MHFDNIPRYSSIIFYSQAFQHGVPKDANMDAADMREVMINGGNSLSSDFLNRFFSH